MEDKLLITIDILAIGAICGAVMAIIALIAFVIKPLKEFLRLQQAQTAAILDMLRQQIIDMTDSILAKDEINKEQIYCLRKLYNSYSALNGNSTVKERVELALKCKSVQGRFEPDSEKGGVI